MASRGSFGVGPQGPTGQSTGAAGGDLGGNYPDPTLQPTVAVEAIIRANRLDQLAVPTATINLNNQILTGVADGVAGTDAMNISQIPTALPPSGSATGDLTGTYPAPTLANTANVQSVVRTNRLDQMTAPAADVSLNNHKLLNLSNGTASSDAANFGQIPLTLPPSGSATGDLAGTYPAPILANTSLARTHLGLGSSATRDVGMQFGNVPDAESMGFDTGVIFGGELNVNISNPLSLDIADTIGYIADYVTTPATPTLTRVSISAQTIALTNTSRALTWWMIDSTGAIIQQAEQPTNTQRRQYLQLGATATDGVTIFVDQSLPVIIPNPINQLYDLMYALGSFNISGNALSAASTDLQLAQTNGKVFAVGFNHFAGPTLTNDPHVSNTQAQNPAILRYVTSVVAPAVPTVLSINPLNFDNAGAVTLISSGGGSATIQRVFLFPTNDAEFQLVIQYGPAVYSSLTNALAKVGIESYTRNSSLADGILLAYVVVTKNCTDLTDTTRAAIIMAPRFANN